MVILSQVSYLKGIDIVPNESKKHIYIYHIYHYSTDNSLLLTINGYNEE